MANTSISIPSGTPICNPSTGVVNQEWRLWFNKVYQRLGGNDAPNNNVLDSDIIKTNENLLRLTERVVINENDIEVLKLDVNNIKTQININNNDINILKNQVLTINSSISSLNSSVNTLNANTIQTISNLGAGIGIYKNKSGNNANLKTLVAGTNISLNNTLNIDEIVINNNYTLPIASTTVLGAIKVGTGLTIDSTGILSTTGGGGLINFIEGNNNTGINATRTVSFLNAINTAAGVDIAIVPKADGSFSLAIPNGTAIGGDKRGRYSVDLLLFRSAANQVASGIWSCLIGGFNNSAQGNSSGVFSGSNNIVVGDGSVILGGNNNNLNSPTSAIVAGGSNQINSGSFNSVILGGNVNIIQNNSSYSIITGGTNNIITNSSMNSTIIGGTLNNIDGSSHALIMGGNANNNFNSSFSNILSGSSNRLNFANYAVVVHGLSNTANARYSSAEGYCSNTKGIIGAQVRSTLSFTNLSDGKTQSGRYELGGKTSSSSSVDLTTNGNSNASTNNQLVIPTGEYRTMVGEITIVDSTNIGIIRSFEIKIRARNIGGTITILTNSIVQGYGDTTAITNGFNLVSSVDTTNGAVKLTASKTTGPDILAYGTIRTTEINN